eukprot:353706-Chlamydomonas_euryale.AAC.9
MELGSTRLSACLNTSLSAMSCTHMKRMCLTLSCAATTVRTTAMDSLPTCCRKLQAANIMPTPPASAC